ncbi:CZB domain-containing protein [Sulfurimonas sp.]|uniref:CZB domain-containing protein n=1 Tax=Sulfurimonas sp. TaxID=2022749 RepID=UPI002B49ED71|nr:CZB domain-containing protein [Sulfurimonas sp.]
MVKEEILKELRSAKVAHIKWVQKAKLLIEGFETDKNSIPVDSTACKFGCWFYGEAQNLNALKNNPIESMKKIEDLHSDLHNIYLNIYKIYFSHDSQGFFSKLFGKKKKITDESTKLGKEYFSKLRLVSESLLHEINRMERRIIAISSQDLLKI